MDKGFFGSLFDLDNNGKLDGVERYLDFKAFEELILKDSNNNEDDED